LWRNNTSLAAAEKQLEKKEWSIFTDCREDPCTRAEPSSSIQHFKTTLDLKKRDSQQALEESHNPSPNHVNLLGDQDKEALRGLRVQATESTTKVRFLETDELSSCVQQIQGVKGRYERESWRHEPKRYNVIKISI
ncbi:unnamed protein product, partial [Coregonus sp. 'balchen']